MFNPIQLNVASLRPFYLLFGFVLKLIKKFQGLVVLFYFQGAKLPSNSAFSQ